MGPSYRGWALKRIVGVQLLCRLGVNAKVRFSSFHFGEEPDQVLKLASSFGSTMLSLCFVPAP